MTLLVCSAVALLSWLAAGLLLRRPPPPIGRGLRARGGVWGRRSVYEQRRWIGVVERN